VGSEAWRQAPPRARCATRKIVSDPGGLQRLEVYEVIRRDLSEERALKAVSALRRATIVPLDASLALEAGDISLALGLAMADSIVYATARRYGARLVTSDGDFDGLPGAIVVK
jgi:predicted nucleic acid-binding protein